MTKTQLKQWLISAGVIIDTIVIEEEPSKWTVRIAFDVGSNRAPILLDELNEYLYSNSALGAQIRVVCRNTYTGFVTCEIMPRNKRIKDTKLRKDLFIMWFIGCRLRMEYCPSFLELAKATLVREEAMKRRGSSNKPYPKEQ